MVKKINIASYKVLQTFLKLYHTNVTMQEMVNYLNGLGLGIFNQFIVQKYIHTLKACGVNIQRAQNKYSIVNFSFGPKITEQETTLLHNLKTEYEKFTMGHALFAVNEFFTKLHLPFFKSSSGSNYGPDVKILKYIKHAFHTNNQVIVRFKNLEEEEIYCVRDINVVDDKYKIQLVNENGAKTVFTEDIEEIDLVKKTVKINDTWSGVIYELFGTNAERYQLRINEKILKYTSKSIVILNEFEDKKLLIQRLLRYDSSCKILEPSDVSKLIKEEIDGALENYNIGPERKSQKYMMNERKKQEEKERKLNERKERQRRIQEEQML